MNKFCTLNNLLRRNLEFNPDKIALIEGTRSFTFAEMVDRCGRMANALLGFGLKTGFYSLPKYRVMPVARF